MHLLLLALFLGLATVAAAATRQAKPHQADWSRSGPEIYQNPLARQLEWLGNSFTVATATTPALVPFRSPQAQTQAIARERGRLGWGSQREE